MGIKISELNSADQVQNNDILPIVQNDETKKVTKEILLGDISQYLRNVYTKAQTDTLLNEKANQDDLDETNTFVTNLRNRMTTAEGNIMDLQTDSVAILELSMNATTYVLTANLKNKAGVIVSTSTVDLPLESLVKDIQYDSTTKEIVFILQDGTERRIPLSDLISGLVNQEDFEASQEEQDTRITDLEKEVEILSETIDSELEDGVATGESITVNDSARAKAKLDVGGNTKQTQTNGYQMIHQFSEFFQTSRNGVTFESYPDGTYHIYGTATASTQFELNINNGRLMNNSSSSYHSSLESGDYTISIEALSGNPSIAIRDANTYILSGITDVGHFSLSEATSGFNIYGRIDTEVTVDWVFKIMLEKGTEAHEWEEYSNGQASPNPEYPQEVQVVKGNIVEKIYNKNLSDEQIEQGNINSSGNLVASATRVRSKNFTEVDENCTYTLNYSNSNVKVVIHTYDVGGNHIGYVNNSFQTVPYTFVVPEDVKKIKALFKKSDDTNITPRDITNLQLENGSTATDYEPHKEQTRTLTLPSGMEMCKTEDNRDGFVKDLSSDKWYKNKKLAKYIFDGTESWNIAAKGYFILNNSSFPNSGTGSYIVPSYCTHFKAVQYNVIYNGITYGFAFAYASNQHRLCIRNDDFQNVDDFKNWLAEQYQNGNPVILYCPLEEPVLEEITDETLISQLDKLYEVMTYYGQTNVTCEGDGLSPIFTLNYKKSNRLLRSEIESIKARLDLLEN